MNIPPICPFCGNWSKQVTGREIHPHRQDLHHRQFFMCKPCDAYVGTHSDTGAPLGTLANSSLRKARSKAHAAFDPLWKGGDLSRKQAYSWLAHELNIPFADCHIGVFDEITCSRVVSVCVQHYKQDLLGEQCD